MAVWRLLPWCFVWTLLLATLAWTQSDEMGSAVIVVLPSQSSVETRVGCQVTICCQGTGQSIQWTPFGQRDPIVNGTDGILIKETRIDESESVDDVVLISKLTYPSIGEEHRGALTCSIDRGPGVNAVTRTYLIFIDPGELLRMCPTGGPLRCDVLVSCAAKCLLIWHSALHILPPLLLPYSVEHLAIWQASILVCACMCLVYVGQYRACWLGIACGAQLIALGGGVLPFSQLRLVHSCTHNGLLGCSMCLDVRLYIVSCTCDNMCVVCLLIITYW